MFNHFNKIRHKYKSNIGDKKKLYENLSAKINPLIKNKNILDIGSGGNIFYDYDGCQAHSVREVDTHDLYGVSNRLG